MDGDEKFPSRSFLLYWQAQAVSGFGSYITLLALQALVVLTLHGSATQVGWLNAARWLPYLVVGIVVGALVDRHARRPIMIGTDLVQAVLLAAIPLLWWMGPAVVPGAAGDRDGCTGPHRWSTVRLRCPSCLGWWRDSICSGLMRASMAPMQRR